MRIVTEPEFKERIEAIFLKADGSVATAYEGIGCVTGPGRSGAVAAVYASHILGVPFIPFKTENVPSHLGRLLIVDTATESGATLRKAERFYEAYRPIVIACFHEPPRVAFWYEAPKPQRYKHERSTAA